MAYLMKDGVRYPIIFYGNLYTLRRKTLYSVIYTY